MSESRDRPLPEEVIEVSKHHLLDTLAAMISGSELQPGKTALNFARLYPGKAAATVVASNLVCGPIEAALANAMLAHSDETDDSHAPSFSHPGCAVVPAALAAGELFNISGTKLLNAVALGYDVGTRVTMTMGGSAVTFTDHRSAHSIAGGFGAAAAAGCAASLNARQMRWLLDYAAQQASGIAAWQRDTDHIEKAFVFAGMPARSGVTAALLVHSGHTGVDDIFSGPDNFLLANAPKSDPADLVDKLGERYEVTRTNIKKWSVGSPIQAPLDALEILLRKRPFQPDEVQNLIVRTQGSSVVDNREIPDICLQHMGVSNAHRQNGILSRCSRHKADAGCGGVTPAIEGEVSARRGTGEEPGARRNRRSHSERWNSPERTRKSSARIGAESDEPAGCSGELPGPDCPRPWKTDLQTNRNTAYSRKAE
jgi:2-methylcitrate dehydratase PrpD